MKKNKSSSIAINGILIALMFAMTCTMLLTGGLAFLPLVVLVVGSVLVGKWTALILGFTFGLVSFISAFIFPSPTAPIFQNPLISILPRVLIGIIGYGVFSMSEFVIKKINLKRKKPLNGYLSKSISTALGSIFVVFFNTLLVLSMIWILYNGRTVGDINVNKAFIYGLISINFVIEIIVTPLISVPVVFAVDKFLKKNVKQVVTQADFEDIENTSETSTIVADNTFASSVDESNENTLYSVAVDKKEVDSECQIDDSKSFCDNGQEISKK